ncbi:MAG: hypothetical protein CVV64_17485 [Candidatus Wallbacteria bacterium HGW-Wallbacteria-1]|jgi:2-polyprenyl-3-methyl-5-hydroxy-6-metoxy-1,4-benzoquinol methylase|uniref:Uncharacterized protein n=1 Tax=Candidatus Wallbacteria bacterium HGW-Wallbacteria-1 TaxID=2013854 RepID=A0A2N1PK47_9BACT|nr:MAG: hypothetical protein CVV64_17485 [Candidatus Wallbacteria bacterium HGW-Wallbacteria-1]
MDFSTKDIPSGNSVNQNQSNPEQNPLIQRQANIQRLSLKNRILGLGFRDNAYGHLSRLTWIASHIRGSEKILEVGCGTGLMITFPLFCSGANIVGVDRDEASILLGRKIISETGLNPDFLNHGDIRDIHGTSEKWDVLILSEVLEHIKVEETPEILKTLNENLRPGGVLLITTPNGYGPFELESALWRILPPSLSTIILRFMERVKRVLLGNRTDCPYPSSLDSSPHVRRFTPESLKATFTSTDYTLTDFQGSVLLCGPLTNALITGFMPLMKLNRYLGMKFPRLSSGFRCAFRKNLTGDKNDE